MPVGSSFNAIPGCAAITRTRRISAGTTTEGFGRSIFDDATKKQWRWLTESHSQLRAGEIGGIGWPSERWLASLIKNPSVISAWQGVGWSSDPWLAASGLPCRDNLRGKGSRFMELELGKCWA